MRSDGVAGEDGLGVLTMRSHTEAPNCRWYHGTQHVGIFWWCTQEHATPDMHVIAIHITIVVVVDSVVTLRGSLAILPPPPPVSLRAASRRPHEQKDVPSVNPGSSTALHNPPHRASAFTNPPALPPHTGVAPGHTPGRLSGRSLAARQPSPKDASLLGSNPHRRKPLSHGCR